MPKLGAVVFWIIWPMCSICIGQHSKYEQLNQLIKSIRSSNADTNKIKSLLEASDIYIGRPGENKSDLDSAMLLAKMAERLSDSLNESLLKVRSRVMESLVHLERREWEVAKQMMPALARQSGALNDKKYQAWIWEALGGYLPAETRFHEDRLKAFLEAERIYKETGLVEKEIHIRLAIAELRDVQGNRDIAEKELLELVEYCKQTKFKYIHRVYIPLSKIEQDKGNFNKGIYFALSAIQSIEDSSEHYNTFKIFVALGSLYFNIGNFPAALEWHYKALNAAKERIPNFIYYDFSRLVITMIKLGKSEEAVQFIRQTVDEFPPNQDWQKQAISFSLGCCYNALEKFDLAEKHFSQVEKGEEIQNFVVLYNSAIAQFYIDQQSFLKARLHAERVINAVPHELNAAEKSNAHYMLFKIDSSLGRYQSALQHLSLHKAISDSVFTETKARQTEELQIQFETVKKEKDLQLKAQSIKILQKEGQLQKTALGKAAANRNFALATISLLVIIIGLVLRQFLLSNKNSKLISSKKAQLEVLVDEKDHLITEKEWLLKELHHRVKNNLQMIISLLESQSAHLNGEALDALKESQSRIQSMSLIHQKLYRPGSNLTSIDMKLYIHELVGYLNESFCGSGRVWFKMELQPISLDASLAIPIGLILNEAITNSLKYAFPSGANKGNISICFSEKENGQLLLLVEDNGIGLPENFDIEKVNSLGLKLMKGLSDDINGDFGISSNSGTRISLSFSLSKGYSEDVLA